MRDCILDCANIAGPEEFHDALVETLTLPGWYGTNLDALYDCLTSITEETRVTLQNFDNMDKMHPGFRVVFRDAQQANGRIEILFE